MPKTSAIERNKKRQRLVAKYAKKRAELKAALINPATTDEEFFAAQVNLQKLPRNSSPVRACAQPLFAQRAAPRIPPQIRRLAHSISRTRPRRQDSRRHIEVFLVNSPGPRGSDMTRAAAIPYIHHDRSDQ